MKQLFLAIVLFMLLPVFSFAQTGAGAVRDYVGLINQTYHPSIVDYFEKTKAVLARQGATNAVRNIDIILSGAFGSGFLYSDARGNLYVLTNNHVVAQAHTISITFERADGTTRKIENLRIIATDEEDDLAILAVPAGGERPFVTRGLVFAARNAEEGENVFAAGFPGLGRTPLWQFSGGMISNSAARFPKSSADETLIGPFIQHTAQIDGGNSGGPLLVSQANAPSGFAVTGMNTLSGINRQAANFAIPARKIQSFINDALNPRPETFRAALDERLSKFVEGLGQNRAVYPHISEFLSTVCIGENAEWASEEMWLKANVSVRHTFVRRFEEDVVGAMGLAVGWTIENSIRTGSGILRASVKEVIGSGEEYTVIFSINNVDVSSVWIREYGHWRIKTFGTVATGDMERLNKKPSRRDSEPFMRPKSDFRAEIGYAYLFDALPAALFASLEFFQNWSVNFYFAGTDFVSIGVWYGGHLPIHIGNFGLMPYAKVGIGYLKDMNYGRWYSDLDSNNIVNPEFQSILFFLGLNGGIKFGLSDYPGLFGNIGYQYNFVNYEGFRGKSYDKPFEMALTLSIGYSF